MTDNPMHRYNSAPTCRAQSKRTGLPCRSPAVTGYRVCRMAWRSRRGSKGKANGNFRHGRRTNEVIEASRLIAEMAKLLRE